VGAISVIWADSAAPPHRCRARNAAGKGQRDGPPSPIAS
jgi:hypothetical protein